MAALTAAVGIEFDGNMPPTVIQMKGEVDTYFRGGLAHHTAGVLNLAPLATEAYAGVVWESSDGAIAANDLIWVAITGRYFWANSTFTDANYGLTFAMLAATLTDNPADMGLAVAGTAGTIGTLDHVASTGVNGWINTNRRAAAENL